MICAGILVFIVVFSPPGLHAEEKKPVGNGDGEALVGGGKTTNPVPGGTEDAPQGSQSTDLKLKIKLSNPLGNDNMTIEDAIKKFMNALVKITIPFIVVFFIWSGLSFVLAQGNPEKIKTAKNTFWYTVIGTLLILGAWAITNAIIGTINSIAG